MAGVRASLGGSASASKSVADPEQGGVSSSSSSSAGATSAPPVTPAGGSSAGSGLGSVWAGVDRLSMSSLLTKKGGAVKAAMAEGEQGSGANAAATAAAGNAGAASTNTAAGSGSEKGGGLWAGADRWSGSILTNVRGGATSMFSALRGNGEAGGSVAAEATSTAAAAGSIDSSQSRDNALEDPLSQPRPTGAADDRTSAGDDEASDGADGLASTWEALTASDWKWLFKAFPELTPPSDAVRWPPSKSSIFYSIVALICISSLQRVRVSCSKIFNQNRSKISFCTLLRHLLYLKNYCERESDLYNYKKT